MDDVVTAINEDNIGILSFEILDYADRIAELFSKIESRMELLDRYYQGDSFNKLISHYDDLSKNYDAIKSNIISYSDDLVALIRKLHETDSSVANIFEIASSDVQYEAKSFDDRR